MTWLFVTSRPSELMRNPDPAPWPASSFTTAGPDQPRVLPHLSRNRVTLARPGPREGIPCFMIASPKQGTHHPNGWKWPVARRLQRKHVERDMNKAFLSTIMAGVLATVSVACSREPDVEQVPVGTE